ncbi:hypothetical protein GR160_18420 [Flavobacterium sp. Sd200]|uniref:hypothetical protein n=1 Tax=Flavobacterium sp. Sd200 TaxID=2692211 RepID=UPI001367B500|nr:hypothetical protein [Flavobacterium sp. Sd200]MXN93208.1 hypothetical protein [Flavobacterium sp. Sd200]
MATIYIIAGPPGIGKSTSGADFIPDEVSLLDADLIAHRYKEQGFVDYKDIGNWRFQSVLRDYLISGKEFAVELNLGFQSHYDLVRRLKNFNKENQIEVVLFHTNDLQLCLDRAKIRHENGLHLVPPETIFEMYHNTIPLLTENVDLFSSIIGIDVKEHSSSIEPFLQYDKLKQELKIVEKPEWFTEKLSELLEKAIVNKDIKQSQVQDKPKINRKRGKGL